MAKKVLIDCDVGVDDALALILAFHSPELDVKAVTGVNGNVPLDMVFPNIQKVLSLIKPKNKPLIARGADRPLKGTTIHAHSVHGKTGLGEAKIDLREGEEWWQKYSGSADELILELASKFPNELTLIAVGPLTNLALALKKDPEGMKKLKELVIMGGSVRTRGNVTPYAEFNIFSDPMAAQIVFNSGIPVTLVPLDATHQAFLTPQRMEEEIIPIRNPFSDFLIKATGYDMEAHRFKNRGSIFLHDPLAVGVAINTTFVKIERLSLHVDTNEDEYYGRITEKGDGPKIDVCLEVDSERFLELFVSRLKFCG